VCVYLSFMDETATRVLYNHDCPVCRAEITHYADYAGREGLAIGFDDLNRVDLGMWGVTADQAARGIHVVHEGRVLSGLPAFITLWRQMPRYRWLARMVALPVIRHVATIIYDYVLAPLLYQTHLRRMRRSGQI
jgi:predicted DCC family thiol-disulfide oxidoreductase YuxK